MFLRGFLISSLLFIFQISFGQNFGNEWIDHGQTYFKIPIHKTGIYRIDRNTLEQAGIPVNTLDPRKFQVFAREKEVPIHVEGENDGSFDQNDFIEFYGEKNDGWLDSLVYRELGSNSMPLDPSGLVDPNYSLYNDTIYYYLTWNSSTSNKRAVRENDVNFSNYTTLPYSIHRSVLSLHSRYTKGERSFFNATLPLFTRGEGWTGPLVGKGSSDIRDIATPSVYQGGGAPDANVEAVSVAVSDADLGNSNYNHHLELRYGTGGGTVAIDTLFEGFQMNRLQFQIPNGSIGSPTTRVTHRVVNDLGVATDYQTVSYISIDYPHNMDLGGKGRFPFWTPDITSDSKGHVQYTNSSGGPMVAYVLNGTVQRVKVVNSGSSGEMLIPDRSNGSDSKCFLSDVDSIYQVSSVEPVSGNGYFRDFSQMDPDSAFIILTHSSLWNEAMDYKNYRQSSEHDAVLVDVNELYHQFGGGIPKHALALRRFCSYALDTWSTSPKYLFLVGKSIREAQESSPGSRQDPSIYAENLVPSFGYPSSDPSITAGLNGKPPLVPAIPVGRLAAKTPEEVSDYLTKVEQYENPQQFNDPKEWMKRVLHFGGGATASEQQQFAGYLSNYEAIIEGTYYGGKVHTFLKNTSSPIQLNLSDSVRTLINNGVSIMTFFGHASGNGFDQNIDDPSSYSNQGKYPMLIANSCYTGDIHQPTSTSASEEFVLADQKGTIGFIASVKEGVAGPLNTYSKKLYQAISVNEYGESIGEQIQRTITEYDSLGGLSFLKTKTCFEMSLHGDPSIDIYSFDKPEYKVQSKGINFQPSDVTSSLDSFQVDVAMTNIGKAIDSTFSVELIRTLPSNTLDEYSKSWSGLYFKDTVRFTLPLKGNVANGINEFQAKVDRNPDVVEELVDEYTNNITSKKELYIRSADIFPVYPYEYAIIPDDSVTLKASTGDPFASARDIIIQMDTTDLFNSPFMVKTTINHSGGVIEWDPPVKLTDSTVYFWRVTPDSTTTSDGKYHWKESSFQYIKNRRGWGQAHYFQYKKDDYNNVIYDRPQRDFDFKTGSVPVGVEVYGNANSNFEFNATQWKMNLTIQEYNGCGISPALHVAVIDPVDLSVWGSYGYAPGTNTLVNQNRQYGNLNNGPNSCRSRSENYFIFQQNDPQQMQDLEDMLVNEIPDGHYVLVYTWRYVDHDSWSANNPNLYSVFNNLGSDSIQASAKDSVPFIFMARKGDPSTASEIYGTNKSEHLTFNGNVQLTGETGNIVSEVAGPAINWEALYWDGASKEQPSDDSTFIQVIGIKKDGTENVLGSFDISQDSVPDLYNYVDASVYPEVKLKGVFEDTTDQTPFQLDRWQLLYSPVPEAAVDPSIGYRFHSDTVQEGEKIEMAVPVRNISEFDMDSLLVSYWFTDKNGNKTILDQNYRAPLQSGELMIDTGRFSTKGFPGRNSIWMEANPIDTITGNYDQLEQYHFNNLARLNFHAKRDNVNPILDVTFDGRHILNGDIVSAEPNIQITLDDENKYLLMDEASDTSNFQIFLTDPRGNQKEIYFKGGGNGSYELDWVPAKSEKNRFKIQYRPDLEKDGTYKLLVQGRDKSDNLSGDLRYEIEFEVINRMTVTNVLNYPNPFSTRTQFVFTLTGKKIPNKFRIQILTVTGKVVREITKHELGPLHIGRNRTSYWWDGTDEFGDRLANGVYLYRVIVEDNGEEVEHRQSGADRYFKKDFGKMYLMR